MTWRTWNVKHLNGYSAAAVAFVCHFAIILAGHALSFKHASSYLRLTHTVLDSLLQWDAQWYLGIAHYGYRIPLSVQPAFIPTGNQVPFLPLQGSAFFPLVPMIVHTFGVFGAVVLGNVVFYLALVLMFNVFRVHASAAHAQLGILLFALNPTMIYESALYTESFTVFFSLLVFYGIRRNDSAGTTIACAAGFLATLNHELGILLLVFAVRYLRRHQVRMMLLYSLSTALGWASFSFYLWLRYGAPFAMFQAQHAWGRNWRFPVVNIVRVLELHQYGSFLLVGLVLLLLTFQMVAALSDDFSVHPVSELNTLSLETGLWLLALLLIALSTNAPNYPLVSVLRFVSIAWPMYSLSFIKSYRRRSLWFGPLLLASTIVAVVGAGLYESGYLFQ